MIYDFIVLIKDTELKKLKLSEIFVEWGGELLPQEPRKYRYNNSALVMEKYYDMRYFEKYCKSIISDGLRKDDFVLLVCRSAIFFELQELLNDIFLSDELYVSEEIFYELISKNLIVKFLEDLFEIDIFGIILLRDEENIDKCCRVKTVQELMDIFCSSLNFKTPRGVFIKKFILHS